MRSRRVLAPALASLVAAVPVGSVADEPRRQVSNPVRSAPIAATHAPSTIGLDDSTALTADADGLSASGFETIEPAGLDGITAAHNTARVALRLEPLTWSVSLATSAQAWANQCVDFQAPFGLIDFNGDRSIGFPWYVGESIAASANTLTPDAVVATWEEQEQYYDYSSNTCSGVCAGYTQLVWSTTRQVGCGIANCPGLAFPFAIVCDYGPGGNTGGRPY